MTDTDKTTNEQIAELLAEQTYDERMAMAKWFCDALDDMSEGERTERGAFADLIGYWSENTLIDEAQP